MFSECLRRNLREIIKAIRAETYAKCLTNFCSENYAIIFPPTWKFGVAIRGPMERPLGVYPAMSEEKVEVAPVWHKEHPCNAPQGESPKLKIQRCAASGPEV